MSHCSREACDALPTAREWVDQADAAVCAMMVALNALRQTPNDHGWAREGQATELKKRTDAYTSAVHHFLTVVRQAHEDHPQALSAMQKQFDRLLKDVA